MPHGILGSESQAGTVEYPVSPTIMTLGSESESSERGVVTRRMISGGTIFSVRIFFPDLENTIRIESVPVAGKNRVEILEVVGSPFLSSIRSVPPE